MYISDIGIFNFFNVLPIIWRIFRGSHLHTHVGHRLEMLKKSLRLIYIYINIRLFSSLLRFICSYNILIMGKSIMDVLVLGAGLHFASST